MKFFLNLCAFSDITGSLLEVIAIDTDRTVRYLNKTLSGVPGFRYYLCSGTIVVVFLHPHDIPELVRDNTVIVYCT